MGDLYPYNSCFKTLTKYNILPKINLKTMSLRKDVRKYILPINELLGVFKGKQFDTCLDVGAGTGIFMELFYDNGVIKTGTGSEVDPSYFRKLNKDLEITSKEAIGEKKFDIIMVNDVLHHVIGDKKEFLYDYINKNLKPGGYVFVKDMNNRNFFFKNMNRLHDMIMARQIISEISPANLKEALKNDFDVVTEGTKRVVWYDHYWVLFKSKK